MIVCWCVTAAKRSVTMGNRPTCATYEADCSRLGLTLSLWGQTNSLILLAQAEATFGSEEGRNRTKVGFESEFESCV